MFRGFTPATAGTEEDQETCGQGRSKRTNDRGHGGTPCRIELRIVKACLAGLTGLGEVEKRGVTPPSSLPAN